MTPREAQSPPKLFNMDAVEADAHTHMHTHTFITPKHSRGVRADTHGHKCTPERLQTPTHVCTIFFLFLPQRQCMAAVLLQLMMMSGSDSATLSRVDALQHSAAMLRKFSVSPH